MAPGSLKLSAIIFFTSSAQTYMKPPDWLGVPLRTAAGASQEGFWSAIHRAAVSSIITASGISDARMVLLVLGSLPFGPL